MENYVLSSLFPFIDEGEASYYKQLAEDVLTHLISLAPFVNNSDNLHKLSKLSLGDLAKASAVFPIMSFDEIEDYFNNLEFIKNPTSFVNLSPS